MKREQIKQVIVAAINRLFEQDPELIRMSINELTISQALAGHIKDVLNGADFDVPERLKVDTEYDGKGMEDTKVLDYRLSETDPPPGDPRLDTDAHFVYPDILMHERMSDEHNEGVIEVKKNRNPENRAKDHAKLRAFTRLPSSPTEVVFGYNVGLALEFQVGGGVQKDGELVAKGIWFRNGKAESKEMIDLARVPYKAQRPATARTVKLVSKKPRRFS